MDILILVGVFLVHGLQHIAVYCHVNLCKLCKTTTRVSVYQATLGLRRVMSVRQVRTNLMQAQLIVHRVRQASSKQLQDQAHAIVAKKTPIHQLIVSSHRRVCATQATPDPTAGRAQRAR